ncbi:MAG: PspC domain-containing protein [Pyrinomonadaceae bacterium]|nr:PspC domain-containing protein [Pyrinomonadaceae bacterium]
MNEKVLRKSREKVIAGVYGGIAEYLGWEPRQVRAIFIFLLLVGGTPLLAYFVLWIAMPEAEDGGSGKFNLEDFREQ